MSGAAEWLAEAWETGSPLAPFPPELAPADRAAGEEVAAALIETLGLAVSGVRLVPAPGGGRVSAPLLDARMMRAGTPISLAMLRHARISAGVLGVLAEPLGEDAPVFEAFHPVLDVAAERSREPATDPALFVADLAALGLLVIGKRSLAPLPEQAAARLGLTGARPRAVEVPLAALMAEAAAEARRWGGLPAGAVLAVVGLGASGVPAPGEKWSAAVSGVGRISAAFA